MILGTLTGILWVLLSHSLQNVKLYSCLLSRGFPSLGNLFSCFLAFIFLWNIMVSRALHRRSTPLWMRLVTRCPKSELCVGSNDDLKALFALLCDIGHNLPFPDISTIEFPASTELGSNGVTSPSNSFWYTGSGVGSWTNLSKMRNLGFVDNVQHSGIGRKKWSIRRLLTLKTASSGKHESYVKGLNFQVSDYSQRGEIKDRY